MVELEADCSRCAGLCCVAPAFEKSSDFAIDKPAGKACPNLAGDFRCTIHERLDDRGFHGCVVFDCFGAGQRLTQVTFGGRSWREAPELAGPMFAALPVVRQLHELLWLLAEAIKLTDGMVPGGETAGATGTGGRGEVARLRAELTAAFGETDELAGREPRELRALDVNAYRGKVNGLLRSVSELARASAGKRRPDHAGANLIGRKLRGADLRGASFRGALLIGADLRDADLRRADFTGADLRGADLRGAKLDGALFLTKSQLRSARRTAAAG